MSVIVAVSPGALWREDALACVETVSMLGLVGSASALLRVEGHVLERWVESGWMSGGNVDL